MTTPQTDVAARIADVLAPIEALIGGRKPPVFLSDSPNKIVRVQQRRDDLGATVTESMVRVSDLTAALAEARDRAEAVAAGGVTTAACPHGDPLCPCPDGLLCHYEGKNPMTPPAAVDEAAVLRAAADAWTQGAWSDVMLPKPTPPSVPVVAYSNRVGDWLRGRAASYPSACSETLG